MKTPLLIVLSSFFLSVSSHAVDSEPEAPKKINLDRLEFVAVYNKKWQADSTDYKSMREEPMILLLGSHQSKFYSLNKHLLQDSILPKYPVKDWNLIVGSRKYPATINFYLVFKNYTLEKVTFIERVGLDLFTYSQPLHVFSWKILPDKKQMFGYSTQKAITSFAGRDWVAWFAPEIPVSDGPYKFNGLPGLIVLLHDTRNHYQFSLISFRKSEGRERFFGKYDHEADAFTTSRSRMIEMRRQFIQNPFGFLPNVTHHGGEAQRQEVLERIRRRNNMLELRY